jgi:chromosome partitioning protein
MKTITLIHYKGGIGKTTLCLMMSRLVALAGYRVLAVDMDSSQNHLSDALGGAEREEPSLRTSKVCASGILERVIRKNAAPNLDVAALSTDWCDRGTSDPHHLRKRFRFFNLESAYDFVVIDTPPGMGRVQEISIHAADEICIPTDLSLPSLRSLEKLSSTLGPKAKWRIVPNFLMDSTVSAGSLTSLQKRYPGRMVPFSIPYDKGFSSCLLACETPFFSRVAHETAVQCCRLVAELLPVDIKRIQAAVERAFRERHSSEKEPFVHQDKELSFPLDSPEKPQCPSKELHPVSAM